MPLLIESPSIMSIRTDSSHPEGAWFFKALETGPSDEPPQSRSMAPMMTNNFLAIGRGDEPVFGDLEIAPALDASGGRRGHGNSQERRDGECRGAA